MPNQSNSGHSTDPTNGFTRAEPGGSKGSSNTPKILIVLLVIAGIAATTLFLTNRDDGGSGASTVEPQPSTVPIFEPKDARGLDPFFPLETQLAAMSVKETTGQDLFSQDCPSGNCGATQGDSTSEETAEITKAQIVKIEELKAQTATGLFGGTEEQTCDAERIISFLFAYPEVGEAWAKVHDIDFVEIPTFIRSLEARVLSEPVNVLNHGYSAAAGAAYEIDSVLAAGTAVLVDADGQVAIRCYCGNPIKAKPPVEQPDGSSPRPHQPPRCLASGAVVSTTAGGAEIVIGAPRDVRLTGSHQVLDGGHFSEVTWGDGNTGWVRSDLIFNNYCPPPAQEWYCPTEAAIQVWATPQGSQGPAAEGHESAQPVGTLGGTITNADGTTTTIYSQVTPVGGSENPVTSNGYILINFTQGSPSVQSSGWVLISELEAASEVGNSQECIWQPRCVKFDAIYGRAGGSITHTAGLTKLSFTGNFITASDANSGGLDWAQVRFADGTGSVGWVTNYVIVDDSQCSEPEKGCLADEAPIFTEPSENSHVIGVAFNASLTVISGPIDGFIQVQVGNTNITGWVAQHHFLDGWHECAPKPGCYLIKEAHLAPDESSATVPVPAGPRYIEHTGLFISTGGDYFYEQVIIDGEIRWVHTNNIYSLADEDCHGGEGEDSEPGDSVPTPPCMAESEHDLPDFGPGDLTREQVARSGVQVYDPETGGGVAGSYDRLAAPQRCCASVLYDELGASTPSVTQPRQVVIMSVLNLADGLWYSTDDGYHFPASQLLPLDACGQQPPKFCPNPRVIHVHADQGVIAGPSPEFEPSEKCCFGRGRSGPGYDYPFPNTYNDRPYYSAIVQGPVGSSPAWYQAENGLWFNENDIINPGVCDYWLNGPATPVPTPQEDSTDGDGGDNSDGGGDVTPGPVVTPDVAPTATTRATPTPQPKTPVPVTPTPKPTATLTPIPTATVVVKPTATAPVISQSPTVIATIVVPPGGGGSGEPTATPVAEMTSVPRENITATATPVAEMTSVPRENITATATPVAEMTSVPRENITATPTP